MEEQTAGRARTLAVCAVMTAALCVLSPPAIPIGPVPVTLATLAVFLSAALLGRRGTASVLAYLLLGLAGAPVFSGWRGGAGVLLGPTGGYLAGYVPLALLAGWAEDAARALEERTGPLPAAALRLGGMLAGTAALYLLGTAWYCVQSGVPAAAALAACVLPFLPADLAKMAAALGLGAVLRRRLGQARLL